MIRNILRLIPDERKGELMARFNASPWPEVEKYSGRKKVVITLAGFYQNLGDMALTLAQKRFIEDTLPGYDVLLLPSLNTYTHMRALKSVIGPEDIITINGGGNMDDVYLSLENARRFVVKSFPDNPVVSFPQTLSFTNSTTGERELQRSARLYGNHPHLSIFAREAPSSRAMTHYFSRNKTYLSPDTVLSLNLEVSPVRRSGIMITLRDDQEAVLSEVERSRIGEIAKQKTSSVSFYDTVELDIEDCQPDTYEQTLVDFWKILRSHQVVVTDRLHSMIFCVITGTPVVVLANSNHKIEGTYDTWLKNCSYVKFIDSFDEEKIAECLDSLWDMKSTDIIVPDLSSEFDVLRQALLDAAEHARTTSGNWVNGFETKR